MSETLLSMTAKSTVSMLCSLMRLSSDLASLWRFASSTWSWKCASSSSFFSILASLTAWFAAFLLPI